MQSRPPSHFKQLTSEEVHSRLEKGEAVYILFWAGMSDIDERALKYQRVDAGLTKVWVNDGDDQVYELDFNKSRTAYEGIAFNRWELAEDEFYNFSKLKPTFVDLKN